MPGIDASAFGGPAYKREWVPAVWHGADSWPHSWPDREAGLKEGERERVSEREAGGGGGERLLGREGARARSLCASSLSIK